MTSSARHQPFVPPPGIAALGPEATAAVERLVADAERRQDAEVGAALADGLRAVPRPLRGIARKVLVG